MLQHVSIELRPEDIRPAVAFWELLGFREVDPPERLRRYTWVERQGSQIHLIPAEEPVVPASGHAAVVVEDYEEAIERLARAGYEADPRREHWGARRAFLSAPGGHRVEIMASPPPTG